MNKEFQNDQKSNSEPQKKRVILTFTIVFLFLIVCMAICVVVPREKNKAEQRFFEEVKKCFENDKFLKDVHPLHELYSYIKKNDNEGNKLYFKLYFDINETSLNKSLNVSLEGIDNEDKCNLIKNLEDFLWWGKSFFKKDIMELIKNLDFKSRQIDSNSFTHIDLTKCGLNFNKSFLERIGLINPIYQEVEKFVKIVKKIFV
ncbi:hypothetical protein EDEG_01638, partial [Edhazardia aedis USNM 41457]